MTAVAWKSEPENHDYPAAASYLSLIAPDGAMGPAELRGRVVWAGSRETGIEVLEQSREYQWLVAAAAGRWALVQEVVHAPDCACAQRGEATGHRQP